MPDIERVTVRRDCAVLYCFVCLMLRGVSSVELDGIMWGRGVSSCSIQLLSAAIL